MLLFGAICSHAYSSGVAGVGHALAPVVTAASSQYFERTFNRLVAAPAVPIVPVAPAPPVVVEPVSKAVPTPVQPQPNIPIQPNVAIAVATAQAAPVATILLPPYPFGPPPAINFIPASPPIVVPDEDSRTEPTTTTKKTKPTKATIREPEPTTPLPSSSNNNFAQALPSNQNVGFTQYFVPKQPLPLEPQNKPQKLKTSVEIERVPLTYIAPPPLNQLPFQQIKHVHTFVPAKTKIIIRPVSAPLRLHRKPVRIVMYRRPLRYTRPPPVQSALRRGSNSRDIEPTTFSPFAKFNTKPPKIV